MFNREIFGKKPSQEKLGKKYTGLVYGCDAVCRRCNAYHTAPSELCCETDKTEFMASKIAAIGMRNGMAMVGVLIDANGRMALGVSGNQKKAQLVLAAAKGLGDPYKNIELAGVVTLSKYISLSEEGHCKTQGAAKPGNCAAPRLLNHAKVKGWTPPFAISEVWCDPEKKHQKFNQNEPIESCYACGKLVPLMMCDKPKGG